MIQGKALGCLMGMVSSPLGIGGVGKDGLGFLRNDRPLDDVMVLHKPHSMAPGPMARREGVRTHGSPHLFHYHKPASTATTLVIPVLLQSQNNFLEMLIF